MMKQDFTVGNHEVDNKSFGIGMAVAAVGTGVVFGTVKLVKWGIGKFMMKKAEKAQQQAIAQQQVQQKQEEKGK